MCYKGMLVAGVDEAGRGPLAGPVVAAAVILDPKRPIKGLNDSKLLNHAVREKLFLEIRQKALAWSAAQASVLEIDTINILQATFLAMQRAVNGLTMRPQAVIVDGNRAPVFPCPVECIVKGDQTEPAISAASIVAKVMRDRIMTLFHYRYPVYGFHQHKGYGTRAHLLAVREHGPILLHRRSFAPVSEQLDLLAVLD